MANAVVGAGEKQPLAAAPVRQEMQNWVSFPNFLLAEHWALLQSNARQRRIIWKSLRAHLSLAGLTIPLPEKARWVADRETWYMNVSYIHASGKQAKTQCVLNVFFCVLLCSVNPYNIERVCVLYQKPRRTRMCSLVNQRKQTERVCVLCKTIQNAHVFYAIQ